MAATFTNMQLLMYWNIGNRINKDVLCGKRAEYGAQIVSTLSTQLTWSHVIEILPLKETLQREFYLTMASSHKWSVRTLRKEITGGLYQRTAIAGKDDKQIHQELTMLRTEGITTPDLVFKNPYFLSFTGLKGYYSEQSLEDALINRIQQFLIELGNEFCFVDRQKRMVIDGALSKLA